MKASNDKCPSSFPCAMSAIDMRPSPRHGFAIYSALNPWLEPEEVRHSKRACQRAKYTANFKKAKRAPGT
eukprot:1541607-Amphidinium_carterae.1